MVKAQLIAVLWLTFSEQPRSLWPSTEAAVQKSKTANPMVKAQLIAVLWLTSSRANLSAVAKH